MSYAPAALLFIPGPEFTSNSSTGLQLTGMAMTRIPRSCIFIICIGCGPLLGQGTTVVGAGYANPTNIRVSPGQITTIFVSGLTPDLTKPQRATSLPLPDSLAGISVAINQSSPNQSLAAPLLAVQQLTGCRNSVGAAPPLPTSTPSPVPPDCLLTAITLQIPFELTPLPTVFGGIAVLSKTELVITANGAVGNAFSILTITDNMHVLSTCDTFPPKQSYAAWLDAPGFSIPVCASVVTHADGTLVTAAAPAKPGETVVIYAFGLGPTAPSVMSGRATPTPAPVLRGGLGYAPRLAIQYDFRPNAAPSNPYLTIQGVLSPTPITPEPIPTPEFVGLTPGQVGLYQINLQLPSTFPSVPPCTVISVIIGNAFGALSSFVQSNLTIDIGGVSSFDGAAICVQQKQ